MSRYNVLLYIFWKQFQWTGHLFPELSAFTLNWNKYRYIVSINVLCPDRIHWLTYPAVVHGNIVVVQNHLNFTSKSVEEEKQVDTTQKT